MAHRSFAETKPSMDPEQRNAMERMPDTRHASLEAQTTPAHSTREKTEPQLDPVTEEALDQSAITLELLIEEAHIPQVAKQMLRADDRLKEQMAAYAIDASRRYHIPVAELDDTEWENALATAVEARQEELVQKGYQFDEEGTMIESEFSKRLEGTDMIDARELTVLRGVLEHAAQRSDSSATFEPQRLSGRSAVDPLGSLLNRPELKAMDPKIKDALAGDRTLRNEIATGITEFAKEIQLEPDQLHTSQIGIVLRNVANAHLAELRRNGVPVTESGNLIAGKRISASDRLELQKMQQLLETSAAAQGLLARNENQLKAHQVLTPLARPVRSTPAPAPKRTSVWNNVGKKVGKLLTGIGIWLAGTSGGEFNSPSNVAASEQEQDRPLPAYAVPAAENAAPESSMDFADDEGTVITADVDADIQEEVQRVTTKKSAPETSMDFADDEGSTITVDTDDEIEGVQRATTRSTDARTAPAKNRPRATATKSKRSAGGFDVDAFIAAGKEATRDVVGTPEQTQRRLQSMRDGKRPLPREVEDTLGMLQDFTEKMNSKPLDARSANKGGEANKLLSELPKAPERRRAAARYKVAAERLSQSDAPDVDELATLRTAVEKDMRRGMLNPTEGSKLLTDIDSMLGAQAAPQAEKAAPVFKKPVRLKKPTTSRATNALREVRAEGAKGLSEIDQQINEVRAAQKRGEISLRDALKQINALKDLK